MRGLSLKIGLFISGLLICLNVLSESVEALLPHHKLVVAIPRINHSIYFFQDSNNEWQGLDVDLARDIAKTLHVPIEFNFSGASFDEIIQLVAEHKADIALGNLSITLDRAQHVLYTVPYVRLHEAFLFNRLWLVEHWKKNQDFLDLLNDPSFRLGTIQKTSYSQKAGKVFPQAQLTIYPDANTTYQALLHQQVDAVYFDDFLSEQYLLDDPQLALYYKVIVMTKEPDLIAIAVTHNNFRLQHWLNHYLTLKHINYSSGSLLKFKAQQMSVIKE